MKVINVGSKFEIYDDNLKLHDKLPIGSYIVRFNKMTGFYLESYSDIEISENKIYGVHLNKVEKVLKNFEKVNRNLGVILSGHKGIGKSLFAKLLAKKAIEKGYPLIIVDSFIPGIASYLESIQQEVIVLFDEFDKTFADISVGENETSPQSSLLTLFDGISVGKKLFVVTCNNLYKLNDFLINRPGRFHYHFRFDYPSPTEIREYLNDKLEDIYKSEIEKVIMFSSKVNLNYDCLRAIVFELNTGESFEEAIADLNIMNMETEKYNITLYFTNGNTMLANKVNLDMFANNKEEINLRSNNGKAFLDVEFNPSLAKYNSLKNCYIIYANELDITYDTDYSEEKELDIIRNLNVDYLSIQRVQDKNLHYLV